MFVCRLQNGDGAGAGAGNGMLGRNLAHNSLGKRLGRRDCGRGERPDICIRSVLRHVAPFLVLTDPQLRAFLSLERCTMCHFKPKLLLYVESDNLSVYNAFTDRRGRGTAGSFSR